MKHRINILAFAALVVLICLFLRDTPYLVPALLAASVLFFIIMSMGVLFMQFNYFLKSTTRLNSSLCLLTFDDGPDPQYTPEILRILAKHEIKAIFFVIGDKVEQSPEIAQQIATEGHVIGNHSQTHNNFMSLFSKARLKAEINQGQESIAKITGKTPQLFRPPIGYTNPKYAAVLRELKLRCIGWTYRSYDSVFKSPEKLTKRLSKGVRPGNIVLLHDNLPVTAGSLDTFIQSAKENGIIFATKEDIKTILND